MNFKNLLKSSWEDTKVLATDFQTDSLRIGVTGLSKSGKTSFIISFITNLIYFDSAKLSGFLAAHSGRLIDVKLRLNDKYESKMFPYNAIQMGLRGDPPEWPNATTALSSFQLDLFIKSNPSIPSNLNLFSKDLKKVTIEVWDYPGEWLFDLPMMDMSFSCWCKQYFEELSKNVEKEWTQGLLCKLSKFNAGESFDRDKASQTITVFKNFLEKYRAMNPYSFITQPSILLSKNVILEEQWFLPIQIGSDQYGTENSYFATFEKRYDAYVKNHIKPFYKQIFGRINCQVMLVDIISALFSGSKSFNS